jgi:hypothetical protein
MTNQSFYAFCRNRRKTETDSNKQQALIDVYYFMRECRITKSGVKQFVDLIVYQKSNEPARVEAYQWLLGVFDEPSEFVVSDGQMQLF